MPWPNWEAGRMGRTLPPRRPPCACLNPNPTRASSGPSASYRPWGRNQETTRAPTPRRVSRVRSSKNRWFRDPCEASNRGPTLTKLETSFRMAGMPPEREAPEVVRGTLTPGKGSAAVGYPGRSGRETKATGSHAATDMISRLVLRRAKPKHTAATSAAKPEKKNPPGAPPEPAGGAKGAEGRGESPGSGGCPGAPRECVVPPPPDRSRESFTGDGEERGPPPKATVTSASLTGIGKATDGTSGEGRGPSGGPGVIGVPGSTPGSVGGSGSMGGTGSVGVSVGGSGSVGGRGSAGGTGSVGVSVGGGGSVGGRGSAGGRGSVGGSGSGGGTGSVGVSGGGSGSVGGRGSAGGTGSVVGGTGSVVGGGASNVGGGTAPASVAVGVPASGVCAMSSARLVAAK